MYVEASQFFSSDSGKIIFFMVPFGLTALGFYFRRIVAQSDAANAKRAETLEKLVMDMSEVAQSVKTITARQEEHGKTQSKHDEMLDKLSQIVTATNATLTGHLEWAHGEYLLLRQREGAMQQAQVQTPPQGPRPFR